MVGTNHEFSPKNAKLCRWLTKVRISRLIMFLIVILVTVPLVTHYYISRIGAESVDTHRSRTKLDQNEDADAVKASDLVHRIDELKRIRRSVNNELRDLESRRQKLHSEASMLNTQIEKLKIEFRSTEKGLISLRVSLEGTKLLQAELADKNRPLISAPKRLLASADDVKFVTPSSSATCRMSNCFDYSRCPITSGFPVYMYPIDHLAEPSVRLLVATAADMNGYITTNPSIACVYLVFVDNSTLLQKLSELPYWRGDGRNHVVVHFSQSANATSLLPFGRAILVQPTFAITQFRHKFDLVVPPLSPAATLATASADVWINMPRMVPIQRKYLLTFQGQTHINSTFEQSIVDTLNNMQANDVKLLCKFQCDKSVGRLDDWALCTDRLELLHQSTFSLVLSPINSSLLATPSFLKRLSEALQTGAVPVILGADAAEMPFSEVLNWEKCAVLLPKARVTELHYILRAFTHDEIFALRSYGREMFTRHFATAQANFDSVLSILRTRIRIPPLPIENEPSPSVFNASFAPLKSPAVETEAETDDILGPLEPAIPSLKFRHNFTQSQILLQQPGDPFRLYPYTPFEAVLPSEAKFMGSGTGFRPIGHGEGGTGREFNEALGGNYPREQFTIVMLTYEREAVLINAIQRLKGLPHLNKVVVVWNSAKAPAADLVWPDIGVEVVVVRTRKNSLNNRFLPYEAIETEAILSIDDDAHLRHDEIMFGFRVWRESRSRLVGFPGRFHAWDLRADAWLYNSNYSCELSMVLTGAAFFHKYYAHLYSYVMPQAIRDKVDEYMNCEDLAMNFLVSHVTRMPPLKVTSRWTFRCPGCPKALSFDDSHFQERHKCLNYFVQVYGYMPLLNTQFRVDSVLFKTRIPHDKQKCFKFI